MTYGRTGRRDGRRFVSQLFYPMAIRPFVWLRSDLGITLNGSKVSAWKDQSGNGKDTLQSTEALQMTYASSGGVGNRPYLDAASAGTETRLQWASGAFAGITTAELYLIFNNATDPIASADYGGLFAICNVAASGELVPYQGTGHVYSGFLNVTRPDFGAGPGTTASPCCYEAYTTSTGPSTRMKINRNVINTINAGSLAASGVCYLGSNTVRWLCGRIYELIIVRRELSTGERAQLYTYFKSLYPGIPI